MSAEQKMRLKNCKGFSMCHKPSLVAWEKLTKTMKMTAKRSVMFKTLPLFEIKPLIQRLTSCPRIKGKRSCRHRSQRMESLAAAMGASNMRLIINGLKKTPKRLEAEAAETARAMLPLAMEVKVMEDWTVEGRADKKRSPMMSSGAKKMEKKGASVKAITGKRTKVAQSIVS
jgi:hypothetical protein